MFISFPNPTGQRVRLWDLKPWWNSRVSVEIEILNIWKSWRLRLTMGLTLTSHGLKMFPLWVYSRWWVTRHPCYRRYKCNDKYIYNPSHVRYRDYPAKNSTCLDNWGYDYEVGKFDWPWCWMLWLTSIEVGVILQLLWKLGMVSPNHSSNSCNVGPVSLGRVQIEEPMH